MRRPGRKGAQQFLTPIGRAIHNAGQRGVLAKITTRQRYDHHDGEVYDAHEVTIRNREGHLMAKRELVYESDVIKFIGEFKATA